MRIDPRTGRIEDARLGDLASMLREGDLLVVNDAATLPASLQGRTWSGAPFEARLAGLTRGGHWRMILLGEGDWHEATSERPAPPQVHEGCVLRFGERLQATVVSARGRLLEACFDLRGAELWLELYRLGRPVQYWYVEEELDIWHVQTPFASRPWAVEMPSAGRPLRPGILETLRERGVRLAFVTHAAGLSATGDEELDRALPLPERFEVPLETLEAIERTRAAGGRVIAAGTSVVRALESAAQLGGGELKALCGETELRIGAGFQPRVVDGLLTGMHEPSESHYDLLEAFAPAELLARATAHAEEAGYLCHEFGDSTLILGNSGTHDAFCPRNQSCVP